MNILILEKKTLTQSQLFKTLNKLKINLSLDDFSTGDSSFVHLKNLPVKTLKIDKTFVGDINKPSDDIFILLAIISLADIYLIAEGIETKEQLDFLIKHHCQQGQGFYLSLPLTKDEMTHFLKKHNQQ